MTKDDAIVGETYLVKVGDKIVPVRLERFSPYNAGGWHGRSLVTGRQIWIYSARRLRARTCAECWLKREHVAPCRRTQNLCERDRRLRAQREAPAAE